MTLDLESGPRLPAPAVRDVAMWMAAFRKAAAAVAPGASAGLGEGGTALMADALRAAGFYRAFEDAEAALAPLSGRTSAGQRAGLPAAARPLGHGLPGEAHALEDPGDGVADEVVHGPRLLVEGRHRREDDPSHLRRRPASAGGARRAAASPGRGRGAAGPP